MSRILVFDNYDSFTYNLVHLVEKILHQKVEVYRNDELALEKVDEYDKIILSPGPGIPSEAGMLLPLIREYAARKSILGVCLGHQAIAEAFGGRLLNLSSVFHGVATPVKIIPPPSLNGKPQPKSGNGSGELFSGLPDEIEAGRYHSWVVSEDHFPADLEVTAKDNQGYIMGLRHKTYDVKGLQFHPESVLTPMGERIMRNWLNA